VTNLLREVRRRSDHRSRSTLRGASTGRPRPVAPSPQADPQLGRPPTAQGAKRRSPSIRFPALADELLLRSSSGDVTADPRVPKPMIVRAVGLSHGPGDGWCPSRSSDQAEGMTGRVGVDTFSVESLRPEGQYPRLGGGHVFDHGI